MKRIVTLLTAVVVLAATATWAADAAAPAPKPGAGRGAGKMPLLAPKALEQLKLTPDQSTKVDALEAQYAKERDQWQANHMEENTKLREDMKAARAANDQAKMKELNAKAKEINGPLMEVRKKYMDQVKALLTDEQKKTLESLQEAGRERMKHGAGAAPAAAPAAK